MDDGASTMQTRSLMKVLLYVVGYGLLVPGVAVTGGVLYSTVPYWTGESCSMALMGIFALPFTVSAIIAGAVIIREARRYGAGPRETESK